MIQWHSSQLNEWSNIYCNSLLRLPVKHAMLPSDLWQKSWTSWAERVVKSTEDKSFWLKPASTHSGQCEQMVRYSFHSRSKVGRSHVARANILLGNVFARKQPRHQQSAIPKTIKEKQVSKIEGSEQTSVCLVSSLDFNCSRKFKIIPSPNSPLLHAKKRSRELRFSSESDCDCVSSKRMALRMDVRFSKVFTALSTGCVKTSTMFTCVSKCGFWKASLTALNLLAFLSANVVSCCSKSSTSRPRSSVLGMSWRFAASVHWSMASAILSALPGPEINGNPPL